MRQQRPYISMLLIAATLLSAAALLVCFRGTLLVRSPQAEMRIQDVAGQSQSSVCFLDDYKEARQVAREQGKPIMLFFTTPDCHFSHRMQSGAFCDERVTAMAKQLVCVKIDATEAEELCREFQIKGYPTIQFMSPQGVLLRRLSGSQTPEQLTQQMSSAIQTVAAKPDHLVR